MPKFQNFNAEGEFMSNFYVQQDQDFGLSFAGDPGLTKAEFQDECDINKLMERYEKTGLINNVNKSVPVYLDLGDASALDLMSAMNTLNAAEAAFNSLPAQVRAVFENDPMSFVAFAEDEANKDQLREWGLVKPKEVEAPPMKVEVVASAANANEPAKPATSKGASAPAEGKA